ncbi:dienelactone hydrolase [Scheffersomyces coipomensis]|uniref:dienelactone hydrolase n=1 Tax=Scheffersomyces coipomensis TaxID=1788519 RepID=UPI00315D0E9D
MASLPPSACCAVKFDHEGESVGTLKTVAGLHSYVTGESYGVEKVIIILSDIFGLALKNNLLLADQLSALGKIQVIIPDILGGDGVESIEKFDRTTFFAAHGPHVTTPLVNEFLKTYREEFKPKTLFGIGYCFGAYFTIENLSKDGLLDAGAVAHPSMVSKELIENLAKPLLISSGEADAAFTPELRELTIKILSEKKDLRWQLDLFQGAYHGYAVKGDISVPLIKYAKEKTVIDQIYWFGQF